LSVNKGPWTANEYELLCKFAKYGAETGTKAVRTGLPFTVQEFAGSDAIFILFNHNVIQKIHWISAGRKMRNVGRHAYHACAVAGCFAMLVTPRLASALGMLDW